MVMKQRMKGGPRNTVGMARKFPTPRSEDSKQTGGHRGNPDTLTSYARLFPTPQSRDFRTCKSSPETFRKNPRPLSEFVGRYPTPKGTPSGPDFARASRPGSGGDDLVTYVASSFPGEITTGSLNPDWVELLMGWPIGWTSLAPIRLDRWLSWLVADGDNWPPGWEDGVPRIANGVPNVSNRLKAIGNGQVPICAAMEWGYHFPGIRKMVEVSP